jgi:chaperonin GroES
MENLSFSENLSHFKLWHKNCYKHKVLLENLKLVLIMNMKPINDRVVVKPAKADEKTSGGIIIPETAKEKPQRGEVIAVGPGKDGNLMTVKEGDIVLYGKYAGQELEYQGQDFLIMREDDILVVLD